MRVLIGVCALIAVGGCSSPTGPTREVDMASQLSWRVLAISPSCESAPAPSPLPQFSNARIQTASDGSLIASWPHVLDGREVLLYARFIRENGAWAMCSWDTADV